MMDLPHSETKMRTFLSHEGHPKAIFFLGYLARRIGLSTVQGKSEPPLVSPREDQLAAATGVLRVPAPPLPPPVAAVPAAGGGGGSGEMQNVELSRVLNPRLLYWCFLRWVQPRLGSR